MNKEDEFFFGDPKEDVFFFLGGRGKESFGDVWPVFRCFFYFGPILEGFLGMFGDCLKMVFRDISLSFFPRLFCGKTCQGGDVVAEEFRE